MARRSKQSEKQWVSASDAGRAAYCPQYLVHKHQGADPSKEAVWSRERGAAKHADLNRQVQERRCYIATYLYGSDDPRTDRLRTFRDEVLMSCAAGRIMTSIYYRISPSLVVAAGKSRMVSQFLAYLVGYVLSRVSKK